VRRRSEEEEEGERRRAEEEELRNSEDAEIEEAYHGSGSRATAEGQRRRSFSADDDDDDEGEGEDTGVTQQSLSALFQESAGARRGVGQAEDEVRQAKSSQDLRMHTSSPLLSLHCTSSPLLSLH
jgi:hypothetical protein